MTREEAIKTLHELWRETNDPWYEEVYNMAIEALSAERTGEWIKTYIGQRTRITCSNCGQSGRKISDNFCPNCGAKMKGGAE